MNNDLATGRCSWSFSALQKGTLRLDTLFDDDHALLVSLVSPRDLVYCPSALCLLGHKHARGQALHDQPSLIPTRRAAIPKQSVTHHAPEASASPVPGVVILLEAERDTSVAVRDPRRPSELGKYASRSSGSEGVVAGGGVAGRGIRCNRP